MDENDFDQILQTDFHPNTVPPPQQTPTDHQHLHDAEQQQDRQQEHGQEQHVAQQGEGHLGLDEHERQQGVSNHLEDQNQEQDEQHHSLAEPSPISDDSQRQTGEHESHPYDLGMPSLVHQFPPIDEHRSQSPDTGSVPRDKKSIQREQNRLAALRSRERKRGRYDVLEQQVHELSEQNEKYRVRLNKLLADRPGSSSPNQPTIDASTPLHSNAEPRLPEVDHQYFRKVVNNLESLKYTLLTKEIELERLKQGEHDMETHNDELQHLRERLIRNIGNRILSQAEMRSIEHMIRNLRLEKFSLAKERDTITREVDARLAIKSINGVGEDEGGDEVDGVEKALLEVRGLIEDILAKWADEPDVVMDEPTEQASQLPVHP